MNTHSLHEQLGSIASSRLPREDCAARIAEAIRIEHTYRWVGLYDVLDDEIAVIAWSGPSAPAYPRFPRAKGLCGNAVATGQTVIANDVRNDPRYLTTLGDTGSEMIVPVRSVPGGPIVGLLDVECAQVDAFTVADRRLLESCAAALAPLWSQSK